MTTGSRREGPDDNLVVAGLGVAAIGPIIVASLLVLVRDHLARSNAALVFVIVVVLAAALGGRWAAIVAALVSAISYDFFLTRPYGSLKIDDAEDIVATVLLLVVGLIVGEVVVWAHRGYRKSERGSDEVARLHRSRSWSPRAAAPSACRRRCATSCRSCCRYAIAGSSVLRSALRCRVWSATARSTPPVGGSPAVSSRCRPKESRSRSSAAAGSSAAWCSSRTPMSECRSKSASSPSRSSDQLGAALAAELDAQGSSGSSVRGSALEPVAHARAR